METSSNMFTGIINNVTRLFKNLVPSGSKSQSVVGIDIGSSTIKAVQMKNDHGTITLETYGEIALGPYANLPIGSAVPFNTEILTKALADLNREANITATVHHVALPSPSTLIFLLKLPKISESNLATIVPNEARKYIPIPLDEISLDWWVIPNKETYADEAAGKVADLEVLVVAVRNDTITEYQALMQAMKWENVVYEVEPFSILRSSFHHEIAPVMVIDIGAHTTRIFIVESGVIRMFHVINRGSLFITETLARTLSISFDKAEELKRGYAAAVAAGKPYPENVVALFQSSNAHIVSEIESVMLQYQRDSHQAITQIICSGSGSLLGGFATFIADHFKVTTVMSQSFEKSASPEFLKAILQESGPTFSVAAGLALKNFV